MCGITGALQFGTPTIAGYNNSALYFITSLLKCSETRGKDATGIAALLEDGNFFVQKMSISATEFVGRSGGKPDDYEGLLAFLRSYANAPLRCMMGHCRKKSVGALDNTDNHPIKAGNILGIHNGTLKNDDEIFKNLGCHRDGKVDSEAIFRLLEFFTNDCKDPFTLDSVDEACKRLEGTFSFLAVNANNPYQVVSARDGRPAEYCLIKPLSMVLVASEKKFIDLALYSYNELAKLFPTGNEQTAFVRLKQSDVEHASLPDNTLAIFDLTKDVTADTKIADLYTTGKIPNTVNRLWKSPISTTYAGAGFGVNRTVYNNRAADNTEGKKTTTQSNNGKTSTKTATTTEVSTAADKKQSGRVWHAGLNKFVKVFGKTHQIESGAVLDTERKAVMTLHTAHISAVKDFDEKSTVGDGLTTEVKKTTDALATSLTCVGSDYPVEKYTAGEASKFINLSPTTECKNKQAPSHVTERAIIELKKGIEKGMQSAAGEIGAKNAVIAAAKNLEKFNSDAMVADLLNMELALLNELQPASLANRLLKAFFGKYFVEGWLDGYKNGQPANNDVINRLTKAENHIRVLKALQIGIIKGVAPATEENLNIAAETARTLSDAGKISKDVMQEVFSVGDFRESELLRRIVTAL